MLEFEVEGKPDVILTMVRSFFESDEWPYPIREARFSIFVSDEDKEAFTVYGPGGWLRQNSVFTVKTGRNLFESPGGFLVLAVLSLLTLGVFTTAYFLWALLRREFRPSLTVRAQAEERDRVKLEISSYRTDVQAAHLATWVQRELVENKAAAGVDALPGPAMSIPKESPTENAIARMRATLASLQPTKEDAADQIRKLAELRDAGAITNAEFEVKKRDLLDRI